MGWCCCLVALSICLMFSMLGLCPKKELRCEDGAMLPFMAAYPVHVCTSPGRAVLGPSHLRKFHLHLNSKFKTGCVIWRLFTFVSYHHLRCCITSPIWICCGTLHMHIIILQSRFEKEGSQDYCCCFFCFCFCCCCLAADAVTQLLLRLLLHFCFVCRFAELCSSQWHS